MAKTFHCSLVTPERSVLEADVIYADIPAPDGQRGFLAEHCPYLTMLGKGRLTLTLPNDSTVAYDLEGGFAQMNANRLTLLSEKAGEVKAA